MKTKLFKAIKDLDATKATRSDGIPTKALKMAASSILQSLTHLFNESLRTVKFPPARKVARVTPLFKGGSPTDCDNHRPISVLPCAEFCSRGWAHRTTSIQFAYSKFSSAAVALLNVVDSWKFAIDRGIRSICVFPDLRKAFNVMKLDFLIAKLESYGIEENTLQWFKSYLSGRSLYVVRLYFRTSDSFFCSPVRVVLGTNIV